MMVMICINQFRRIVQLVTLQEHDTCTISDKFLSLVASQHGLLECITSGCDPHFFGQLWDQFIFLLDMTLTFSMAMTLRLKEWQR